MPLTNTASRFPRPAKLAAGSGGSVVVDRCQVCDAIPLESILFVGYLPPVNTMVSIGSPLVEQAAYPAQLLRCPRCSLAQIGLIVDPAILFPPTYPYTSGTTRILPREFCRSCSGDRHSLPVAAGRFADRCRFQRRHIAKQFHQ